MLIRKGLGKKQMVKTERERIAIQQILVELMNSCS
jgi:hypothetical protein